MYNFDKKVDRRNTNAMKLEGYESYIFGSSKNLDLPYSADEFIHMWVADMEFACAPEILDAIRERLDREILGYTANYDDRLFNAIKKWCSDKYDWDIKREQLLTSEGVIPALERIIKYVLKEDEKALFQTPGYGQFALCCERMNREYITSDLIYDGEGGYSIDFDDLDEKMGRDDVQLFIFCSPHNPTGRAWSEDELQKIAELVKKHNIFMISDEIHCDLRRKDAPRHIPFAKIMPDYEKLALCMAASKTFNLAGLQQSAIFIRDKEIRHKWKKEAMGLLNPLSLEGTIAAYEKGGAWLNALTEYLDENFKFMNEFIRENLPKAKISPSETTYLGWVDFREYFEEDEDVELFFAKKAGVLIEADKSFVDNANRMVRLNLACPKSYLEEGLRRMSDALNNKDGKFLEKR